MPDEYNVSSTSNRTGKVEDIEISVTETTRKVLRATLVDNPKDASACVKVTILHQRKGLKSEWTDEVTPSLARLKAGDARKLDLSTSETLKLHKALEDLFRVYADLGIPRGPWGDKKVVVGAADELLRVDDPERRRAVQKLLAANHPDELWNELVENDPTLATKLARARMQHERASALALFENMMTESQDEGAWQAFFEANTWVFGYGLAYRFLNRVADKPYYGGRAVKGGGASEGDFLLAGGGSDIRFTVLVEIKRPSALLLERKSYRNRVYPAAGEPSQSCPVSRADQ